MAKKPKRAMKAATDEQTAEDWNRSIVRIARALAQECFDANDGSPSKVAESVYLTEDPPVKTGPGRET